MLLHDPNRFVMLKRPLLRSAIANFPPTFIPPHACQRCWRGRKDPLEDSMMSSSHSETLGSSLDVEDGIGTLNGSDEYVSGSGTPRVTQVQAARAFAV